MDTARDCADLTGPVLAPVDMGPQNRGATFCFVVRLCAPALRGACICVACCLFGRLLYWVGPEVVLPLVLDSLRGCACGSLADGDVDTLLVWTCAELVVGLGLPCPMALMGSCLLGCVLGFCRWYLAMNWLVLCLLPDKTCTMLSKDGGPLYGALFVRVGGADYVLCACSMSSCPHSWCLLTVGLLSPLSSANLPLGV